jgi:hypothetical protein
MPLSGAPQAAFRATLEEISEASLVLHVVDASRSDFAPHVAAVESVLAQLDGVEHVRAPVFMRSRPRIHVHMHEISRACPLCSSLVRRSPS